MMGGNQPYHNQSSQAEKRRVLANDARTTYSAMSNLEPEPGGRFAKRKPANHVPQLPDSSPWHSDPVPNEEPLGIDVDAVEPVGTQAEIEESLPKAPAPLSTSCDGGLEPRAVTAPTTDVRGSSFRRRILERTNRKGQTK